MAGCATPPATGDAVGRAGSTGAAAARAHAGAADEQTPHAYFNKYGETKSAAEEVYHGWYGDGSDKTLTVIRPTVVFGPENRGNVYNLLKQLSGGKFVMIGDNESKCYVPNFKKRKPD